MNGPYTTDFYLFVGIVIGVLLVGFFTAVLVLDDEHDDENEER